MKSHGLLKLLLYMSTAQACFNSTAACAADAPAYEAFKKFCVATDAKPASVKVAAEAAGGHAPYAPASTRWPFDMTNMSWDVILQGKSLSVSAGTLHAAAHGKRREMNMRDCIVTKFERDDASADLIRKWVGVPPTNISTGDPTIYYYSFQQSGHVRTALPKNRKAMRKVENKGHVWGLVLLQSKTGVSVQLSHTMGNAI